MTGFPSYSHSMYHELHFGIKNVLLEFTYRANNSQSVGQI